jgi:hypothetical protein
MLVIGPAAGAAGGVDITAVEGQSLTGNVVTGLVCPLESATITWGDGTTSAGASDGSTGIQGTHTYVDEGTYSGSVSYTYTLPRPCQGSTQTASFQATVQDALLTGGGTNVSGNPGQPTSGIVMHFSDANPGAAAGEFSAQITWGDGAKAFGIITAAPAGGFDVSGTHTYNTAGSYPVSTSVTDIGGSTAIATSAAQIAAPPPPPPPPPPLPNITASFIVNPSSPCVLAKTLLDARDSTLVPGGTNTTYFWDYNAIDGTDLGGGDSPGPVFDATNSLPFQTSQEAFRGEITRDVPGFGPWVFRVFRVHVLAPPVHVTLEIQQIVRGRGLIYADEVRTITFSNPDESLLIASPGSSLGETPPWFVVNPSQRHGCPAITDRAYFGVKGVPGSVALAKLAHASVVLGPGASIKLQVGCTNPSKDCFASLDVLSRAPKLSHAARARGHRSLPPSLGSKTLVLPAGKTTLVTVPLNAHGRALARAHKLRKVTLLLGSVGAGGKSVSTIQTVRLRTGH